MPRPETSQHREAFEVWYGCRRDFKKTAEKIGQNLKTLYGWSDRYGWYERAEARDTKAFAMAEDEATRKTAQFLKAQQQAGQLLRLKGVKHLTSHDVEDGRTAIAAIKTGIDIERQALGLPEWIAKILSASDDDLNTELAALEQRRREAFSDSPGSTDAAGDNPDD